MGENRKTTPAIRQMMPFAISVNTDGYEGDDAQTDIIIENDGAGVLHDVAVEADGEVQYFSNVKQLKFTSEDFRCLVVITVALVVIACTRLFVPGLA